jgi:hypothetical protein
MSDLEKAQLLEARETLAADDDVIHHGNPQNLA